MLALVDLKESEAFRGLTQLEQEGVEREWSSDTEIEPLTVASLRKWLASPVHRRGSGSLNEDGFGSDPSRAALLGKIRELQRVVDVKVREVLSKPSRRDEDLETALESLRLLLNLRKQDRDLGRRSMPRRLPHVSIEKR